MATTNDINIQDLIKSFSAGTKTAAENYQKNLKNVKCVSSADLMSNYIAGTSIDARFQFEVVQDANGDPILFSISSPEDAGGGASVNQLYVTMRDESVQTGWTQFNISPTASDSVTIIGISQDLTTGDYVLAAATATEFYITSTIPSDTTKIDWTQFSSNWFARPGMPSGASVTKILVGDNQTLGKLPLIIAAIQIGNNAEHYFVNGDTTVTENCWSEYVLPAQTAELIDLAIGMMYFDQDYWLGTYALYTVGSDLNLTFSSVPDATNITHSFELAAPAGTTVLQTLPDINNSNISTLFVSGNGLYVYESQTQVAAATSSPKVVCEAALISNDAAFSNVKQLLTRQDDEHISIWVRNSSQALWYVRGDQLGADDDAARNWTTPLSLRQNVAQIAAIRNKNRMANAVLTVQSDGQTVAYLWQDPTTTLWKDSDMPLPALSTVQEFPCYTSVLAFIDENGNPVINQEVQITASEWTYATVNGFYKTLDSTTPVSVATDSTGKVTIINKVTSISTSKATVTEPGNEEMTAMNKAASISTPSFSANAPFMTGSHTVNPAQNVFAGLANIKTGQDLLDATTQNGQQVITGDLRNNQTQLNNIASSIQQAVQMANTLPDSDDSDDSGSSIASSGSSFQPWGLSFAGGGATFFNGDAAVNLFSQSASFTGGTVANAIVSIAGDVFEAMLHGIEKVGQILIQAAGAVYNIVVQIGEQILSFVIQTVGDVLNLLSWIFQEIEVGLDKLIGWLGFIFDWDDIITTHKVFTNIATQTLDYYAEILQNAETPINTLFGDLISTVQNLPALQIPDQYNMNLATERGQVTQNSSPAQISTLNQIQSNSGINFTAYQAAHSGLASGVNVPDGTFTNTNPDLETQLKKIIDDIAQILKDFFDTFKDTIEDIINLYNDGDFTLANIAKVVTKDFIVGLLEVVRDILITILDVAEFIIEAIVKMLTAKIEIPFLSGLYSRVTDGSDFSALDCFSLLASIPVTIGYKLMSGQAPFANGTGGLDTMSYTQIYPPNPLLNLPTGAQSSAQSADAATASRSANLTESISAMPFSKATYSQVGGLMYIFSAGLSYICTLAELAFSEEALKKSKAAKVMYFTDVGVDTLAFATSFPFLEGDTQTDKFEWGVDFVLWLGDGVNLLVKAIAVLGKHFERIKDETAALAQAMSNLLLGELSFGLNVASCALEAEQGLDGWGWMKQGQNISNACGESTTGFAGLLMIGSEDTDDPATLVLGGGAMIFAALLTGVSLDLALVRLINQVATDIDGVYYLV